MKKFKIIDKYGKKFHEIFGENLMKFAIRDLLKISVCTFDVVAFDDWMIAKGYDIHKHGSLSDYITRVYGKGALELIEKILNE